MNEIYIHRSSTVAARELGGEMIIMSATDSTLFSLNETATVLWQAADGKTSLREIVELRICQEFNVEPEEAYRDATELAQELAVMGILSLSDGPIPEPPLQVLKKA
jgi:Coenzyme PQQ synthesis protein D (PqqD)